MKTTLPTIRRDTRVFISAVSRELGSVRKLVKKGLEDNDYHAVEQDNFPPDYRQLVDKLRERIASCDAVIHIAGRCYGAEPNQRPSGAPRRSYTQMEYDLAVELGKPVYLFLTGDGFPVDQHEPEGAEQTRLQEAHRRHLSSNGQDYCRLATREELDQKIRSLQLKVQGLQEELAHVDVRLTANHRNLGQRISISLIVLITAIVFAGLLNTSLQRQAVIHTSDKVVRKSAEQLAQAQVTIERSIEAAAKRNEVAMKHGFDLLDARNRDATLQVRIWTKDNQRSFLEGSVIPIFVHSNQDAFLTVLTIGPKGDIMLLVPNRWAPEFRIFAGETVQIPNAKMDFEFEAIEPHGLTELRIIASKRPFVLRGVSANLLQEKGLVQLGRSKGIGIREKTDAALTPATPEEEFTARKLSELFEPHEWAEDSWTFTTHK